MGDIFNVSPPAWLQDLTRSNDKGLLGGILGEIAGGGLIAATKSNDPKIWLQELPQSVAEAHLNFLDPTWRIKLQQGQLNIAHTGLQLQEMQQQIGMNATKIRLTAEDTAEIPKWLQEHPTVESRMEAQWPAARTPEWNKNLDQLRLRDSQSVQSKVVVSGVKSFSDRLATLAKDDATAAAQIAGAAGQYTQRGQMPPPELLESLATAESAAQMRKENERTAAANAAIAAGQVAETRISEKGVTTIYKPKTEADTAAAANRSRVGTEMTTPSGIHALWVGPNQIRITPKSGEKKDFTPGQLIAIAEGKSAKDPDAIAIKKFLGEEAMQQIGRTTNAPPTTIVPAATPTSQTNPAKPTTKAHFDALPSGAYFINPSDGKLMRKK